MRSSVALLLSAAVVAAALALSTAPSAAAPIPLPSPRPRAITLEAKKLASKPHADAEVKALYQQFVNSDDSLQKQRLYRKIVEKSKPKTSQWQASGEYDQTPPIVSRPTIGMRGRGLAGDRQSQIVPSAVEHTAEEVEEVSDQD